MTAVPQVAPEESVATIEARIAALAAERREAAAALAIFDDTTAGELLSEGLSLEDVQTQREPLASLVAAADAGRRALEGRLAAARAVEFERELPARTARVAVLDDQLDTAAADRLEALCAEALAAARWRTAWRAACAERGVSPRWAQALPTEADPARSLRKAQALLQALEASGAPEALLRRAREALVPVEQLLRPRSG